MTPDDFTFTPSADYNTYFNTNTITAKIIADHLAFFSISATSKATLPASEIQIGSLNIAISSSAGSFVYVYNTSVAGGCIASGSGVFIHPNGAYPSNRVFLMTFVLFKT